MSELSRAITFAMDVSGIIPEAPMLVINDINGDTKRVWADAESFNPQEMEWPDKKDFASIVIFAPKQKDEMRYLVARSFGMLRRGGLLIVAASNEAGGKILGKTLTGFGVKASDISKHKCRVVWTSEPERAASVMVKEAETRGDWQQRQDGMWTMPGLFSWDRLDSGTDILLHHLPFSLSGIGADFGCGIGVIGMKILSRYKDVTKLFCLDIDARAVQACEKNLEPWRGRVNAKRADLTRDTSLRDLDFVVMNPPFHTGKKQSIALGQAFITTAALSLKKSGVLVFVANSHLPYEATLKDNFSFHRTLSEANGFKIIEAVK